MKKIICAKASVIMMNWTPRVRIAIAPMTAAADPPTSIASGAVTSNCWVPGKKPQKRSPEIAFEYDIATV